MDFYCCNVEASQSFPLVVIVTRAIGGTALTDITGRLAILMHKAHVGVIAVTVAGPARTVGVTVGAGNCKEGAEEETV